MDDGAELRSAIAADPDAIENWLVYADWLTDRGDPRGELINLELVIENGPSSEDVIARHRALVRDEAALLSPRLEAEAHHLTLDVWRGFIRAAKVFGPADDPPTAEVLAALYADPHACVLRELDLRQSDVLLPDLATLPCASIREVLLGRCHVRELALAEAFPELTSLYCHGGATLERIAHPRLEAIRGLYGPLRSGRFDLPRLKTLHVDGDPLELFDTDAILARPPASLTELSADVCSAEFIAALRTARVTRQLRKLSISIDEPIIEELERDVAPFRHIEISAYGHADTAAQRDALVQRIARILPSARVEVFGVDDPATHVPDPREDRPLMTNIGDALVRSAERLRRRT